MHQYGSLEVPQIPKSWCTDRSIQIHKKRPACLYLNRFRDTWDLLWGLWTFSSKLAECVPHCWSLSQLELSHEIGVLCHALANRWDVESFWRVSYTRMQMSLLKPSYLKKVTFLGTNFLSCVILLIISVQKKKTYFKQHGLKNFVQ